MKYLQTYLPREAHEESCSYLPAPSVLRDLTLPAFSFPSREANQFDLQIAWEQASTFRYLASRYLDAAETAQMMSTTSSAIHHTIDAYMSAGVGFRKIKAKTKLGWWPWSKSCTISVECEPICPSITIHRGWLR